VKVGRAALDEDAIRLIEQHHPELEFDWTRILKGQGSEPPQERRATTRDRAKFPTPNSKGDQGVDLSRLEQPHDSVQMVSPEPRDAESVTAAGRKLGAEGLARLRGRYAEVLARITDRVADPERQAELKTTAERLNPDAWVTDADVLAGLDAYEATFESLRSVVGQRRRRVRRPHGAAGGGE
jgi:hypothetical protein